MSEYVSIQKRHVLLTDKNDDNGANTAQFGVDCMISAKSKKTSKHANLQEMRSLEIFLTMVYKIFRAPFLCKADLDCFVFENNVQLYSTILLNCNKTVY